MAARAPGCPEPRKLTSPYLGGSTDVPLRLAAHCGPQGLEASRPAEAVAGRLGAPPLLAPRGASTVVMLCFHELAVLASQLLDEILELPPGDPRYFGIGATRCL